MSKIKNLQAQVAVLILVILIAGTTNVSLSQNYTWGSDPSQTQAILQSTSHFVGIGESNPTERLHIGNGNLMIPYTNGFSNSVGNLYFGGYPQLGAYGMRLWSESTTPWSSLDIKGTTFTLRMDDATGTSNAFEISPQFIKLTRGNTLFQVGENDIDFTADNVSVNSKFSVIGNNIEVNSGDLVSNNGGVNFVSLNYNQGFIIHHQYFNNDGRLIIAPMTTNPSTIDFSKAITITRNGDLLVNQKIYTTEINVVMASQFPDYVFGDEYKLMGMNELRNYIKVNRSLPGMPSETEVKEEGLNLGENQRILVEKIEELTLYILELESRINDLEESNK